MVTYQSGQRLHTVDFDALAKGSQCWGVLSGLQVSWVSGLQVRVATGSARFNTTTKTISSEVTFDLTNDVDSTYPRKVIIQLDSAGNVEKKVGTPAPASPPDKIGIYTISPEPPAVDSDAILLAEIWLPAGATTLSNNYIYDKRHFVYEFRIEPRTSDPPSGELWDGRIWLRTDL